MESGGRIEVITYDQLISSALKALEMAGSDVGSEDGDVETQQEPEPTASTESTAVTDDPWGSPPSGSLGTSGDDPFASGYSADDEPPF